MAKWQNLYAGEYAPLYSAQSSSLNDCSFREQPPIATTCDMSALVDPTADSCESRKILKILNFVGKILENRQKSLNCFRKFLILFLQNLGKILNVLEKAWKILNLFEKSWKILKLFEKSWKNRENLDF